MLHCSESPRSWTASRSGHLTSRRVMAGRSVAFRVCCISQWCHHSQMNPFPKTGSIKGLLIANRGEIAIRVMRAAAELGLRTVAIHSREDRFSLHRTKADESYLVGDGKGPIDAYLDIADIVRIATEARVDAIHPGYGFLSESPEFAEACAAAGIIFVGPLPDTMRRLGNKIEARNLAMTAGVAVMAATAPLPPGEAEILAMARAVGFPLMLKASWGGGG